VAVEERPRRIEVLVVDDSATARTLLTEILESDSGIHVIGTAKDGEDAVQQTLELSPDLITMDVNMPRMDGIEATKRIMSERPTPILIVTGVQGPGTSVAFDAIAAGALEVIEKPLLHGREDLRGLRDRLISSAKLMAVVRVVGRKGLGVYHDLGIVPSIGRPVSLIGLGASTGGPTALRSIFKDLPADFPVPIVVVQHLSTGFLPRLVSWLQNDTPLQISIASNGQMMRPSGVYFAPDNYHLGLHSRNVLALSKTPRVNSLRPSATVLFESMARVYGRDAMGVLLTGMGDDGASGLKTLHDSGGPTVAQDKTTSAVYGMPKVAANLGAVDYVVRLEAMGPTLLKAAMRRSSVAADDSNKTKELE
jgi:two-component system, chemotaxis family, protein-glutamate methylesterase/glutaminase